jgi:hypothetical protein
MLDLDVESGAYALLLSNKSQLGWKTKLEGLVSMSSPENEDLMSTSTYLYSSLTPYAIIKSGKSFITDTAAAFIRSNARRSFGFLNLYLSDNLSNRSLVPGLSQEFFWVYALVESSTIYADYNPCLAKEIIRLFEESDIFKSVFQCEILCMYAFLAS